MIIQIRKDPPAMDLECPISQPQCLLLNLPPELRNQIWRLLLLQDIHKRRGNLYHTIPEHTRRQLRFCANVLRTCKQINAEGTPILYGENIFSAHRNLLATLPSFVLHLSSDPFCCPPVVNSRVVPLIRRFHIFVRLDTDPRYSPRQVEESFSGVEELRIDVFQSMYGSCDFSVLKLFEGVRGVGKVVIEGSLGDRKYADWLGKVIQLPLGEIAEPFWEEYVGGVKAWDAWTHGSR
jgi:hypothetical protein